MNDSKITCWNCGADVSLEAHGENDGQCPHCFVEIDLLCMAEKENQVLNETIAELEERGTQWRSLALQFDRHRMQAIALIRLAASGEATKEQLDAFINAAPTSGEELTTLFIQDVMKTHERKTKPAATVFEFGRHLSIVPTEFGKTELVHETNLYMHPQVTQCQFLKDAEKRLNAVLGYTEEFDDLLATVNTACLRIRRLEDNKQLIEAIQKAAIHVKPTCGQLYEELNAVLIEHKAVCNEKE